MAAKDGKNPASATKKIPTKANCVYWDHEDSPPRSWVIFERMTNLFFSTTRLQIGRELKDPEKNLILLESLGSKGLEQFLHSTDENCNPETLKHDELLTILRSIFKTTVSKVRSFHEFATAIMEPSETVNDYIARVSPLLRDADIAGKDFNYLLAMKLAQGCGKSYPDVQKTMLTKDTPDLSDFKSMLLAAQTSRSDQRALNREPSICMAKEKPKLHKNDHKRPFHKNGEFSQKSDSFKSRSGCIRCGAGTRHNKDACPAKDSVCHKCGKPGHWQKCCLSGRNVKSVRRIGTLTGGEFDVEVQIQADGAKESHKVRLAVDSGADISGIAERQFLAMFSDSPTRPVRQNILNFDGSRIEGIEREFCCVISYGEEVWHTWLPILPDSYQPIIGKDGIKALNMTIRGADMTVTPTKSYSTLKAVNKSHSAPDPQKYEKILAEFQTVTSPEMGRVPDFEHKIELTADAVPKVSKLRPIPAARREAVKEAVDELESLGIWKKVERAQWVLNLVTVNKSDGSLRVTTDFKPLNKFVKPVIYPLPSIEEIHSELSKAKFFSTLDIVKFYHNIPLSTESQELTATITPWGLYQYETLPMGLSDAGAVAQKYISELLKDIKNCRAYVDDIVVYSETIQEHDEILKAVLKKLAEANLRIKRSKCQFGKTEIEFLGRTISHKSIKPSPKNVQPIKEYPQPKDLKSTQRFLGLMNYHSSFIPNYTTIAEPLRALTRKNTPFQWTEACENAFQELKRIVCSDLQLTPFDPAAKTFVTTDASNVGIGGLLSQMQDGKEVPIAYGHHTLNDRQRNYSAGEREALAALFFVEYWEKYLLGKHFVLRSDHQTLRTLLTQFGNGRKSGKFQRWYERLQVFDYSLEYHPGKENRVADALSRVTEDISDCAGVPDPRLTRVIGALTTSSLSWQGLREGTKELKTLSDAIEKSIPSKALPQHLAMYSVLQNYSRTPENCDF